MNVPIYSTSTQHIHQNKKTSFILIAVDAFVACGGTADKTGIVKRELLIKIVKVDFGLTIDIEVMTREGGGDPF